MNDSNKSSLPAMPEQKGSDSTSEWDAISEYRAVLAEDSFSGGRVVIWLLLAFMVTALVWSSWAELDEVTRGQGKVVPSRQLQVVQNMEGGILAEILVSEGAVVERDQVLLNIDNTSSTASFRESRFHYLALKAKASRLRAEAEDSACDPPADVMREAPQLVEQEFKLYHAHKKELEAKMDVSAQQIAQVRQELAELRARKEQSQRSYELVRKELKLTKPLVEQGAVSEVELLRLRRTVNDIKGDLDSTSIVIQKVEAKLQEVESKAQEVVFDFRNGAREELNKTSAELERLQETNVALEDRVARTRVRAPMRGTVKQLLVNTIGGVLAPGQKLVEIVPLEDTLLIEVKIRPGDIAFLHPGQPAIVKFSAYDFSRYGGMEAELEHISADTIVSENDNSSDYYLVRVRTKRSEFVVKGEVLPIIPGMTATVDILTGKKSVLDYMLKPIFRARENALSER